MVSHTEESLDKLLKKDLINLVLKLQEKVSTVNEEVLDEVRKINKNFERLESDLSVTKNANCLLQKQIVKLERECWANAQYSRRECLEVVGIPSSVSHDCLEDKVLDIFDQVGCRIKKENIEACHRLNKNSDRTIIKFSKRKESQQVLAVKRDLKNLDMESLGLPADTKIFINQSLCPYYMVLWSKSKKLSNLGKIHNFYFSNGIIKIKVDENSQPISISHSCDFEKYFPGVDLSPDN